MPNERHVHNRFGVIFHITIALSAIIMLFGLIIDGPAAVWWGLCDIITRPDLLITDYVATSGAGAAMVNCGLLMLISVTLLRLSGDPFNGYSIVTIGLMGGFGFFGKNIVTVWPFIIGGWLYARVTRRPYRNYVTVSLLSSALSPLVSHLALGTTMGASPFTVAIAAVAGLAIGFVMPALCPYTYRIQNGMNLYNVGFASGLMAMMIVPLLYAAGDDPQTALHWAEGWNMHLLAMLWGYAGLCLVSGLFFCREKPRDVLRNYRELLGTTGRTPGDYLRMFGFAPTLVNMGVNGLWCLLFLWLIGGDLNGPTAGAVFTVMGFSAWGKHLRNMLPVMGGVVLGGLVLDFSISDPSLQIAALFVTTLAPIAGHFGWPFGIAAGFIHSALVLQTAGPVSGLNLYNNGFSGGLIAIVVTPTAAAIFNHTLPKLRDASFFEVLDDEELRDHGNWDKEETAYLHPLQHHETHDEDVARLEHDMGEGPNEE